MTVDGSVVARRTAMVLWLLLVWVLLWGSVRVDVLLSGLLVAVASVYLSALPPLPLRSNVRWRPIPGFAARLAIDLVRSSVDVALAAVRKGGATRSSVLEISLPPDLTDTALVVACNRISLEPGTFVVEIDRPGARIFVYQLDTDDEHAAERARQRAQRVLEDVVNTVVRRAQRGGGR